MLQRGSDDTCPPAWEQEAAGGWAESASSALCSLECSAHRHRWQTGRLSHCGGGGGRGGRGREGGGEGEEGRGEEREGELRRRGEDTILIGKEGQEILEVNLRSKLLPEQSVGAENSQRPTSVALNEKRVVDEYNMPRPLTPSRIPLRRHAAVPPE